MRGSEKFSKKPFFIKEMFNSISFNYDKLNNIMTFGMHKRIKKETLKFISLSNQCSHPKILDLCTGTGDIAGILKEKFSGADIIGVDFSEKMLEIARRNHDGITFLEADCSNLPFEDDSFDLCVISFGLRNVENIDKVLSEIYRVLKSGGVFVNLDLGKPNRFFNFFLKPYMYFWVSFVGKFFHGDKTPYEYLAVSNETFPSQNELVKQFEKLGYQEVKNKNYLFGQIASQICRK